MTRTMVVLDETECWALLRSRAVGRVAVNRRGAGPLVVPVNDIVDKNRTIVFRTDPGPKLGRVGRAVFGFQVDDFDHDTRTGWSVLIDGLAHELHDGAPQAAAVEPWLNSPLRYAERIVPSSVSGRRVQPA